MSKIKQLLNAEIYYLEDLLSDINLVLDDQENRLKRAYSFGELNNYSSIHDNTTLKELTTEGEEILKELSEKLEKIEDDN